MKRAAHFLRTIEERNLSMKCVRKCYEKRSGEETDGKVANEDLQYTHREPKLLRSTPVAAMKTAARREGPSWTERIRHVATLSTPRKTNV
ncbi:hypothetical protein PRIPAC_76203, partial [Pristionchus pacificus]|uniref:Uncharacterized protein n=1 Tax=Pristionchus pacificus TaxID=54126 RepID=A0A2A6BGJ0_PRIPA